MQAHILSLHIPLTSWSGWKVRCWNCTDKYIFIELSTKNSWQAFIYDLYDTKLNLGVGEMGFMLCDLHVSLK